MQKPIVTLALLAACLAPSLHAQAPAPVVAPSSPAPQIADAPMAAAPNQVIYSPRLPSADELTKAAAAQGVNVDRITQTASQVTVTYRYSNGQINTVAYQLLPNGTSTAPAATTTTTVVQQPAPAVVYAPPPRVVYYEEPAYYPYPRYYYPPVSLSFGFGYRHFGGGYGGFHHHR